MTDPDSRPQPEGTPPTEATAADSSPAEPTSEAVNGTGAATGTEKPADAPAEKTTEEAAGASSPSAAEPTNGTATPNAGPSAPVDPQLLFGSLSLSSIEADIDRMMNDKMTELDGMLAGLEQLVVRLEGEITALETPPDDSPTP